MLFDGNAFDGLRPGYRRAAASSAFVSYGELLFDRWPTSVRERLACRDWRNAGGAGYRLPAREPEPERHQKEGAR